MAQAEILEGGAVAEVAVWHSYIIVQVGERSGQMAGHLELAAAKEVPVLLAGQAQ
jgi:hypothetical protein